MTHHKRSDDIINVQLGGARKDERRHPAASSIYEPTTRLIMAKRLTTEEFIARARKEPMLRNWKGITIASMNPQD